MKQNHRKKTAAQSVISGKQHAAKGKAETGWGDLLPGMILLAVLPVLTLAKQVPVYLTEYPWYPSDPTDFDYFMYWKSILLLVLACWMLLVLADRALLRRIPLRILAGVRRKDGNTQGKMQGMAERLICAAMAGYLIFTGISCALAVNKALALHGMQEQYEHVFVLIAYIIVFVYFAEVSAADGSRDRLLVALTFGALLQDFLGISQLLHHDFWSSTIGRSLICLPIGGGVKLHFVFADSAANSVYMGSFNPNYAGVYCALVIPVCLYFAGTAKAQWRKIMGAGAALLLVICLAGSGSKWGLGILALQVLAGICLMLRRKWILVPAVIGMAGLLFVYDMAGDHVLRQALQRTVKGKAYSAIRELTPGYAWDVDDGSQAPADEASPESVLENAPATGSRDARLQRFAQPQIAADLGLDQIEPVTMRFKKRLISFWGIRTMQGDALEAWEWRKKKGEPFGQYRRLPVVWDTEAQMFYLDLPEKNRRLRHLRMDAFYDGDTSYLQIAKDNSSWFFVKEAEAQSYAYLTVYGETDEICNAETALPGMERAFTNRGYLWGRTLPLLRRYGLFGCGPDNFTVVFPQDDYLVRSLTDAKLQNQQITKPHSMYLQTALQNGIPALLCLILLWGTVLGNLIRKGKAQSERWWALLLIAAAGYLLMGLLNDSNLAAAPVFWAVLGMCWLGGAPCLR